LLLESLLHRKIPLGVGSNHTLPQNGRGILFLVNPGRVAKHQDFIAQREFFSCDNFFRSEEIGVDETTIYRIVFYVLCDFYRNDIKSRVYTYSGEIVPIIAHNRNSQILYFRC
jgi:hypothetical protein